MMRWIITAGGLYGLLLLLMGIRHWRDERRWRKQNKVRVIR